MSGVLWDQPSAKRIANAVRKIEKMEPPKLRQQPQTHREASTYVQWFKASKLLYAGVNDPDAALVHKGDKNVASDWEADIDGATTIVYGDKSTQGVFLINDVFAAIFMDGWRPISPGRPRVRCTLTEDLEPNSTASCQPQYWNSGATEWQNAGTTPFDARAGLPITVAIASGKIVWVECHDSTLFVTSAEC